MTEQDAQDILTALTTIVLNAKLIPDPAMQGATDTYSVPLDDIADAGLLLVRLDILREDGQKQ